MKFPEPQHIAVPSSVRYSFLTFLPCTSLLSCSIFCTRLKLRRGETCAVYQGNMLLHHLWDKFCTIFPVSHTKLLMHQTSSSSCLKAWYKKLVCVWEGDQAKVNRSSSTAVSYSAAISPGTISGLLLSTSSGISTGTR